MKTKNLLLILGLVGLLATGCTTPYQVKNLARENQRATDHMARVHQNDLSSLSSYDKNRVAQFNRLLVEYFSLREDMVRAFNDALDRSKEATLAELDREFDDHAEKLLTVDFWIVFREEANKDLNATLFNNEEQARSKAAAAKAYPADVEAINQSLLATRKAYAGAALKFDAVEKSFAQLARMIRRERDAFHVANEKRLADIKPLNLKEGAKTFTLSDNAVEIKQRLAELGPAYQTLRDGQGKLSQYLDEYNPSEEFIKGVVEAFIATKAVADTTGAKSLSTDPADPAGGALPGLDGLLKGVQVISTRIGLEKTKGLEALAPVLEKVMAGFRPVIKTDVPEVPANDAAKAKTK